MDESLLLAINGLRAPWLDAILSPLSSWGIYAFPLLMLSSLLRGDRRANARSTRDGWLVWFLATFVTETLLKRSIGRLRPTADEGLRAQLEVLGSVPSPDSLSMPSGTATAAFAGATWIALRWGWKPGAPALALASLVSFSRLYGGVHWPSDVLVGGLVGAGAAWGLHYVGRLIDGGTVRSDRSRSR